MMVGGPTKFAEYGMSKYQEKMDSIQYKGKPEENPYIQADKILKSGIAQRNEIYQKLADKKFDDIIFNLAAQADANTGKTDAAKNGSEYDFMNGHNNVLLAAAYSANKANTIKALQYSLKEGIGSMTDAEFESAFNIKLADTNYSSVKEFATKVADDIKDYSETVDKVRTHVINNTDKVLGLHNSTGYERDFLRSVQEDMVKLIAFNKIKSSMASKRAESVSKDLLSHPELSNSSAYVLRTLSNPKYLNGEMGNIDVELNLLKSTLESATGEEKKKIKQDIKNKEREKELLNTWLGFWKNREVVIKGGKDDEGKEVSYTDSVPDVFIGKLIGREEDVEDENGNIITGQNIYDLAHKDVLSTFRELVNLKNKQVNNDTSISEDTIQKAHKQIIDFITLSRDSKDYLEAMDGLYNPANLQLSIKRMLDGKTKGKLLLFLDAFENTIANAVIKANRNEVVRKNPDKIKSEVLSDLYDSPLYKKILAFTFDENFGVNNSEYVYKLISEFNQFVDEKLKQYDIDIQEFIKSETETSETSVQEKPEIIDNEQPEKVNTDWESIINNAAPNELDKIIDQIDSSDEMTPELLNFINKKRESFIKEQADQYDGDNEVDDDNTPPLEMTVGELREQRRIISEYDLKIIERKNQFDKDVEEKAIQEGIEYPEIDESPFKELKDKYDEDVAAIEKERDDILRYGVQEKKEVVENKKLDNVELAELGQSNQQSNQEFSVDKTDDGFNVVDYQDNIVNNEPIQELEVAEKIADDSNNNLNDADFIVHLTKDIESSSASKSSFQKQGRTALTKYNKKNNTEYKTLQEFYNTIDGKQILDKLYNKIFLNKVDEEKKKVIKEGLSKLQQKIDFTPETVVNPQSVTVLGLNNFLDKLTILQETNDVSEKSSTFVLSNEFDPENIFRDSLPECK